MSLNWIWRYKIYLYLLLIPTPHYLRIILPNTLILNVYNVINIYRSVLIDKHISNDYVLVVHLIIYRICVCMLLKISNYLNSPCICASFWLWALLLSLYDVYCDNVDWSYSKLCCSPTGDFDGNRALTRSSSIILSTVASYKSYMLARQETCRKVKKKT